MTQSIKKSAMVLIAIIATIMALSSITRVSAQEASGEVQLESVPEETQAETSTEAPVDEAVTEEIATTEDATDNDVYSFVAQKGDSYTKIARKSVQIYGFDNTVELSGAQIVFIETNLTILAGSPMLEIGEQVTVNKATIAEWVEKAKALTDSQIAAWQVYADKVDFNTDNVGESRQ